MTGSFLRALPRYFPTLATLAPRRGFTTNAALHCNALAAPCGRGGCRPLPLPPGGLCNSGTPCSTTASTTVPRAAPRAKSWGVGPALIFSRDTLARL